MGHRLLSVTLALIVEVVWAAPRSSIGILPVGILLGERIDPCSA